jgi:hypothetical protein
MSIAMFSSTVALAPRNATTLRLVAALAMAALEVLFASCTITVTALADPLGGPHHVKRGIFRQRARTASALLYQRDNILVEEDDTLL